MKKSTTSKARGDLIVAFLMVLLIGWPDLAGAVPFDSSHAAYDTLLKRFVTDGRIDYEGLRPEGCRFSSAIRFEGWASHDPSLDDGRVGSSLSFRMGRVAIDWVSASDDDDGRLLNVANHFDAGVSKHKFFRLGHFLPTDHHHVVIAFLDFGDNAVRHR